MYLNLFPESCRKIHRVKLQAFDPRNSENFKTKFVLCIFGI